jgi:hypothetical protein
MFVSIYILLYVFILYTLLLTSQIGAFISPGFAQLLNHLHKLMLQFGLEVKLCFVYLILPPDTGKK